MSNTPVKQMQVGTMMIPESIKDDRRIVTFKDGFTRASDLAKAVLPTFTSDQTDDAMERIEDQLPPCPNSVWSIFEAVDRLNEVALEATELTLTYTVHWGPDAVQIKLPDNPTWWDLAQAADRLVKQSQDQHHVFVEGFIRTSNNTIDMYTGS